MLKRIGMYLEKSKETVPIEQIDGKEKRNSKSIFLRTDFENGAQYIS